MQMFGMSKFLKVNESKVTMVARKRSRPPHSVTANMRSRHKRSGAAVRQVVGAQRRYGTDEGRSGDHAAANSTRENDVFVDVVWGWHL